LDGAEVDRGAVKDHAQLQPVLILADQFAHALAAGAVTALADLSVDEGLQVIGQVNLHRAGAQSPRAAQ
jgi:hypothetical protein